MSDTNERMRDKGTIANKQLNINTGLINFKNFKSLFVNLSLI